MTTLISSRQCGRVSNQRLYHKLLVLFHLHDFTDSGESQSEEVDFDQVVEGILSPLLINRAGFQERVCVNKSRFVTPHSNDQV